MRVSMGRRHVLGDALWLSQAFGNTDSKFWCYLAARCIYLGAPSLPFCAQIRCSCSPTVRSLLSHEHTVFHLGIRPPPQKKKTTQFHTSPVAPEVVYPLSKHNTHALSYFLCTNGLSGGSWWSRRANAVWGGGEKKKRETWELKYLLQPLLLLFRTPTRERRNGMKG